MARVLGLGTAVGVDDNDSGSVYTAILITTTVTPPPRRRVRVPGAALSDTLMVDGAGMEETSDFVYTHYYDPVATNDTILKTLFDAKTAVLYQITYADAGTETFEGVVMGIEPQPIVHDQYLTRTITIHRTGDITFA